MDVTSAIKGRRSVRRFKNRDVPDATVRELLELANSAPSAGNLQARDFIVVRDMKIKNRLVDAALGQDFIVQAPVVIVVCANSERIGHYGNRGRSLYCIQDASAAVQNILLAAYEKGLGTCWIGAFDETAVSKILGLPTFARPVAIIPVGFPDEKPEEPDRLPIDELVHYEKW